MKQQLLVFSILFFITFGFSQSRILIFHKTNGFRHTGAINNGIAMFEEMGNENNEWLTDNSQDSSVFTTANLAQYDVVVFLNTSGSDESPSQDGDLLSSSEKAAFENFIANGKGFIGIHAATDTYRDGVWPFYNELVGGIVQTSPNHTSNNFNADLEVKASHPTVDFLGMVGSIWNKDEEYYYWETNGGQLSIDNTVLLEVESTGNSSYDAARPITWYKESITYDDDNNVATPEITLSGFRSFYTALGHNGSDYSNDSNFRTLLKNATLWALGNVLSVEENQTNDFKIAPNPTRDIAKIHLGSISEDISLMVYDILGKQKLVKVIKPSELENGISEIDLTNFSKGVYLFQINTKHGHHGYKVIKY
ncbi:ThuA domain-containing protein [Winogradskyella flava]|uniref:ThuA domain-containing protein n=1 Tax=Winogradskyella flava TaxID=1884876 RepID=UPI0024938E6C|nr:ThuA domain-containing protein [Winogradskyella flava]